MLYTIPDAAKAMGLAESVILKAIEDRVITAKKKVSGEWHVQDVELDLLYLYLARNYCKHHWQTDPQRHHSKHQQPEIAKVADHEAATVQQEQDDMHTLLGDLTEPSRTIPKTESTCQDDIRIDDRDRICGPDPRRGFQARRAVFFAAAVLLVLGCIAALSSLYSSVRIPVTEQAASPLIPVRRAEEATIAASVEPSSREEVISNAVVAGSKNSAQERSSPPPVTPRAPTTSHAAAKKEQAKERRNLTPAPETRPTTIPGWAVTSVNNGIATLQGPEGTWKVARGDTVPILGKIDSVVLWGNRWIVATSKGLITTP